MLCDPASRDRQGAAAGVSPAGITGLGHRGIPLSHSMYEVAALLPASSDFTLERAVEYFASLTFSQFKCGRYVYRAEPVRAELVIADGEREPAGFRVWYGLWAVVAWLEEGERALTNSKDLRDDRDLPAPAEVIAGCSRWLWVCSDADQPDFDNSDRITEYTTGLRERFGAFILDYVNGGWWT